MKYNYETRVREADGTRETQFVPQAPTAPRIKTQYERGFTTAGQYSHGRVYKIDPEKMDEPAEEALASEDPAVEEQREQEKAAKKVGKKGKK